MSAKPTLYLIDGNSYIYRAFYAIRNLSTSKGFPTNAIYGFTTMLMKVVGDKKPDYLAVAFDPKGPTKRHELYKEYKATRPAMPEGLVPQIPYIHKVVEAFNIPVLLVPGVEADDVIAAVAVKAKEAGLGVTVVTGDKDLFQLIDEDTLVYDTMKDELYGVEECINKFGVPPEKIPDLLGLIGDSSDNIPGVPGVGPKTAVQLVAEFGGVEEILANLARITKPKLRELLTRHAEDARLSKGLVELSRELPEGAGGLEIEALKRRGQDSTALVGIFKELEFAALLKFVVSEGPPAAKHVTVSDEKALAGLMAAVKKAGSVSINVQISRPLPMEGEPVGMAFCHDEAAAYYVPFGHVAHAPGELFPARAEGQLSPGAVAEMVRPVLEDAAVRKYGHNIKSDIIALHNMGITLRGAAFDTMVGSYLLNPGRASHGLENVALEYLSVKKASLADAAGSGAKQLPLSHVDVGAASRYSCEDAHAVFRLSALLMGRLKEEGLWPLFEEVELPLISVLAEMERAGVYVDAGFLGEMSKEIGRTLEGITARIYMLAGEEFNINSPKQLAAVLFERLGLPPVKRTKSGYSTDEEVLVALAASHELPAEVLNYRELYKLKSTYVDALPKMVNPRTGRVHTSFNQAVTATGRLSSSEPNLQNIPIRGETGGRIRKAFAAPPGSLIISADYSQVELRIMAHLSGDASLIESFRTGEDVHARTASEVFGLAPGAVTSEMRRKAKAINFGIMYGMSAYGLSGQIGVHPKEAQKYIGTYFERHAGVKEFIEKTLAEVSEKGYATTIFGRRRPVPEINSDNKATRALGERLAVNTPIQGSAADLIKAAMIRISRRLREEGVRAKMVLQVHDELVFEVDEGDAERVRALAREEMEGAAKLSVPIVVDIGSGRSWGEAH